ncbi:MAG: esterase [Bacteroidetes bacterium]|nr:esterase [Bacteroidota bacterium]MBS1633316.1 esterase [Bacteroidota bacterium]
MPIMNAAAILPETIQIPSRFLKRMVQVDLFLPYSLENGGKVHLLLINDGQNLEEMGLGYLLNDLYANQKIHPVLCAGIYAGNDRKMEYGVAGETDYLGRGASAGLYTSFILEELLPELQLKFKGVSFIDKAFAGFSLGGLSALDIVWNHPAQFNRAGVFSGSLWWRSVDQDEPGYADDEHRIMQQQVRNGEYIPGLKFFFQCGNKDETKDRNGNGIIDSVDDTLDLIKELKEKGYKDNDIYYLEFPEGKHDIPTWSKAMPFFLEWSWGKDIETGRS